MIGLIGILCIIITLTVILIAIIVCEIDNIDSRSFCVVAIIVIVFTYVATLVVSAIHIEEPTAIDVYRGKTTLEITYKENVPIDSVVVFK